ncbi:type II secretion system F family protein [Chloroflexota bacterium]
MVKGKLAASSEEAAAELLNYAGYRTVNLKPYTPFFSLNNLLTDLSRVKPTEVIIFYQQLAMLLETGNDISSSLEILQTQIENRAFKQVLSEIISDVRGGRQLSSAMEKHPRVFPQMRSRLISIGEQGGNLETVLTQIADDMEKEVTTTRETKNAMMYPIIAFIVTIIVVSIMLIVVLPSFSSLYSSLNTELPATTKVLISLSNTMRDNGLFILLGVFTLTLAGYFYIKTERGRYNWDKILLKVPYLGRVRHLIELARCCRSLSLLFNAGLPLTEALSLISQSCDNRVIAMSLKDVHRRLSGGEGLSGPMSDNKLFLPLMVQMVRVGEETGNLDNTLITVSRSYSAEAEYKLKSVIALIQPVMTLFIGLVIGLIALSMTSALYGIYGGF